MNKSMAKKTSKKDDSFESSLKRLEEIVQLLEDGQVPLSNAVSLYEEGIQLSKVCLKQLTEVETKLKKITAELNGSFKLSDIE
jgi:exodeoxyribonuclease VII small subunit